MGGCGFCFYLRTSVKSKNGLCTTLHLCTAHKPMSRIYGQRGLELMGNIHFAWWLQEQRVYQNYIFQNFLLYYFLAIKLKNLYSICQTNPGGGSLCYLGQWPGQCWPTSHWKGAPGIRLQGIFMTKWYSIWLHEIHD